MKEIPMKIRPLQDHIIMKRIPEEEKSRGGIIIPDTAKEKPLEGLVVAVGNGKVLENGRVRPLAIKPGDRGLFIKHAGDELKLNGEEPLLLPRRDILGVSRKQSRKEQPMSKENL